MMWYWGGGVHWWGWLLGAIAMVAFWAAVIWVIWYLLLSVARRPQDRTRHPSDARRILDERLARGEIDAEEYRRLRDLLEEPGPRAGTDEHLVDTTGHR